MVAFFRIYRQASQVGCIYRFPFWGWPQNKSFSDCNIVQVLLRCSDYFLCRTACIYIFDFSKCLNLCEIWFGGIFWSKRTSSLTSILNLQSKMDQKATLLLEPFDQFRLHWPDRTTEYGVGQGGWCAAASRPNYHSFLFVFLYISSCWAFFWVFIFWVATVEVYESIATVGEIQVWWRAHF